MATVNLFSKALLEMAIEQIQREAKLTSQFQRPPLPMGGRVCTFPIELDPEMPRDEVRLQFERKYVSFYLDED